MKVKIKKYRYETIEEEVEVEVPEKRLFYFMTGIRQAYCVTPEWTTWNKEHYGKDEEIHALNIIAVDPTNNSIQKFNISVGVMTEIDKSGQHPLHYLVENILRSPDDNTRTEEQFMADYKSVLESFTIEPTSKAIKEL